MNLKVKRVGLSKDRLDMVFDEFFNSTHIFDKNEIYSDNVSEGFAFALFGFVSSGGMNDISNIVLEIGNVYEAIQYIIDVYNFLIGFDYE